MTCTKVVNVPKRRKYEEVLKELVGMLGDPIKPDCELCNVNGIIECGISINGTCGGFFPTKSDDKVYLNEHWYQSERYNASSTPKVVQESLKELKKILKEKVEKTQEAIDWIDERAE